MSNELLFVVAMVFDLAFVLVCFRLGRDFLYVAVVANIIFSNIVSSKIVTVLGFDLTIASVFYAAIFLATDLLSEHHGPKAASRAVWMGFVSLIPVIVLAPFVAAFAPAPSAGTDVSAAMDVIFSYTPRIIIASLCAYLVSQNVDVLVFEWIRGRFPGDGFLWLRNNGSTLTSQLIDQVIFITVAFAGVVPGAVLVQLFVAGYVLKIVVALCDTPFIYLSKMIAPPSGER